MKKINLDPLALDRETIAKLDERQLQEIVGGSVENFAATSGVCTGGSTDCSGGTSGDCTSGPTTCFV
ncbi:class I lanthipeptide [Pedobacter sp. ISL-64]|uniref:class I lanthipeptide n=1 Tax=Pedobacter sp. ISL-64 TaxID=2819164 RepID=UPI001BECAF18|nr:class I lanthipeptide [Pedobacter sp. ISL-64]MBT2562527.1 class I lanthipeptide [Pedobacter sp. ISL-64]